MSWHRWGRGLAVALFLGLWGCASDSMTTRVEVTPPSGDGCVINGSVDSVALRARAMLEGLGLKVEVHQGVGEMRLECTTASGKRFYLNLLETTVESATSPPTQTTVTRVHLDWENGADDATEIRVMAGLGSLNATGGRNLAN